MINLIIGALIGAAIVLIGNVIFVSRIDEEGNMKMSKKKQIIEIEKDIERLESQFTYTVILQEEVYLILEHLGLEYKSSEERAHGMKGKLYKKPKSKQPIGGNRK